MAVYCTFTGAATIRQLLEELLKRCKSMKGMNLRIRMKMRKKVFPLEYNGAFSVPLYSDFGYNIMNAMLNVGFRRII
jgi:hypothetical protein